MNEILKTFKKSFYFSSPRAATSLYLLFRQLRHGKNSPEVIIPNIVCPSLPLVATFAGVKPVFSDVDVTTLVSESEHIEPLLNVNTIGVVSVGLFGKLPNLEKISSTLKSKSIPLIEDLAQSLGSESKGRACGSWGEFSVVSLSDKKIVPGRGGLLFFQDSVFARELEQEEGMLPEFNERQDLEAFNKMVNEYKRSPRKHEIFPVSYGDNDILKKFRDVYIGKWGNSCQKKNTYQQLEDFSTNLREFKKERYLRYENYRQKFSGFLSPVSFCAEEMVWRVPFVLPEGMIVQSIVEKLRKNGVVCSDLYWPVRNFFEYDKPLNSDGLRHRILNLPVDFNYSDEMVDKAYRIIKNEFSR